jgi:hypothetical protein
MVWALSFEIIKYKPIWQWYEKNSLFSCVHQPRKKKRVGFKQTPQERIGDHSNIL